MKTCMSTSCVKNSFERNEGKTGWISSGYKSCSSSKTKPSTWKFSLRRPTQWCKPFVSSVLLTLHWRIWSRNWTCNQWNSVIGRGCQKKWTDGTGTSTEAWWKSRTSSRQKTRIEADHCLMNLAFLLDVNVVGASGARWRWTATPWFEDSFALIWSDISFGRFWFCTSL